MKIHAMVIDNSGIMRKMVIRSLSEANIAKFTFTEGTDGLDALEKFDPSVHEMIFVDWNMPKMNGLEFIRKIREMTDYHVPVAMISTESTMGKVEEAMEYGGVDAFICKPFTTEVLKQKLESLFNKLKDAAEMGDNFFGPLANKFV